MNSLNIHKTTSIKIKAETFHRGLEEDEFHVITIGAMSAAENRFEIQLFTKTPLDEILMDLGKQIENALEAHEIEASRAARARAALDAARDEGQNP